MLESVRQCACRPGAAKGCCGDPKCELGRWPRRRMASTRATQDTSMAVLSGPNAWALTQLNVAFNRPLGRRLPPCRLT